MTLSNEEILSRILERKPLSIIRAGDGEKIVLDGFKDDSEFNKVLKRQLGFSPPIEHALQIRDNLITAYREADIIGVPMQKNLSDLNQNWKAVEKTLETYIPIRTELKCSMDVFYDFLYAGDFDKILSGIKVLNYISCRNLNEQFARTWNIKQVNSYIIAPEAKFTSGYDGEVHYPTQYNKAQWWMSKCEIEGAICLVGAGFIGKQYCNWFKNRGGIALDIGAVMDLWAGKATRGKDRGLDAERLDYKL